MVARKIGKSWYVDFRWHGRRIRKRPPLNTKAAAQEFERQLRHRLLYGEPLQASAITFAEFAADWVDGHCTAHNRPGEVARKRSALRRLLPFFGAKRLQEIRVYDIERFTSKLINEGLRPGSVNSNLTVLSAALSAAVRWELIRTRPKVRLLPIDPVPVRWLTSEESAALVAAAPQRQTLLLCALRTGMRRGELQGLKWDDIDLGAGVLRVNRTRGRSGDGPTKSGKARAIPITPDLLAALRAHRHLRGAYVFCRDDGKPLNEHDMRQTIHAARDAVGLGKLGWHTLRHSFACQLCLAGCNLRSLQLLLGHAKLSTTQRYLFLTQQNLQNEIFRLVSGAVNGQ